MEVETDGFKRYQMTPLRSIGNTRVNGMTSENTTADRTMHHYDLICEYITNDFFVFSASGIPLLSL